MHNGLQARLQSDPHGAGVGAGGPAVPPCEVVTVPERQGLETVDILRLRGACGPVLHEGGEATLSFLVPVGAADTWHLPGGSEVRTPPPDSDRSWLLPPSPECALTDPALLRAALGEAVRTLAASGSDSL
jgi:hypothetical protein